jgi:hypothetical protein
MFKAIHSVAKGLLMHANQGSTEHVFPPLPRPLRDHAAIDLSDENIARAWQKLLDYGQTGSADTDRWPGYAHVSIISTYIPTIYGWLDPRDSTPIAVLISTKGHSWKHAEIPWDNTHSWAPIHRRSPACVLGMRVILEAEFRSRFPQLEQKALTKFTQRLNGKKLG